MTRNASPGKDVSESTGVSGAGSATPSGKHPDIPDHELIKPIGRGSYGEVWLGRTRTGSYRAIKVVYRHSFEAEKPYEREFIGIKEFEPISRSHPAQIDILHVGRNDEAGYFYYVMELADDESAEKESGASGSGARSHPTSPRRTTTGSTITRVIHPETYEARTLRSVLRKRGRLPVEECLQIATPLAEALEHLHSHGLVHRDIKPSNVIFVNGRPKLADIGLVARADATLSLVGTEGYLPPEGPGKAPADVFSLGKMLYEMATGKDRNEYPALPVGIEKVEDHEAFLEFNAIVLKACEDSPDRRYRSASDLVGDLKTLQAGKSVRWKNLISRAVKRSFKIAAAAAVLASVAFLAVKAFRPAAPGIASFSQTTTVPVNFQLRDIGVSLYERPFDFSPNGRRLLFADPNGKLFLYENEFVRPLCETQSQEWTFQEVAWHPDSETFAVAGWRREELTPDKNVGELNKTLFIGNVHSNRLSAVPASVPGGVIALLWRPDGLGFTVRVNVPEPNLPSEETWDIDLDGTIRRWPNPAIAKLVNRASSYSPDGRWLCGGDGANVWLISADGTQAVQVTFHPYLLETHPTWADDETLFFVRYESPNSAQDSRLMRLHINPETGVPIGEPEPLTLLRWSQILHPRVVNGGKELLFVERKNFNWVELCSYPDEDRVRRIGRGDSPKLSPDGSEVYYIDRTAGQEGIYARATKKGSEPRQVVRAAGIPDNGFDVSPDGSRLVYTHLDSQIRFLVEVARTSGGAARRLKTISNDDLTLTGFPPRWSPREDLIAVVTGPRHVALVDPNTGKATREIELGGDGETKVYLGPVWSPTGEYLAFIVVVGQEPSQRYCVDVYSVNENTWKRIAEEDYIEMLSWRPHSERGELTYFTYDYPNCHRSVFLNGGKMEYLLPVRPVARKSSPGELDFWGCWGPQGQRFYFWSDSEGTHPGHMHVFHADTGQVDHEAVPDNLPFWSRDGSTMGWVNSETHFELKAMELK